MPRSRSLAAASGLLLAALVSGCATADGTTVTGTAPAPVASSEVADVQHTSSAEPVPEPVPDDAAMLDCTNMLTTDAYAALDEQGMEYRPNVASYPPLAGAELVADGALECLWDVPPGDARVWIARLMEPQELWDARVAELARAGWTAADGPMAGAFIRYPEFDEETQPAIAHIDGVTYFAAPGRDLRWIAAIADRFGD
ncbi:hypothetical protein [Agromyces ramosus]|uniref:DUF3558 domain-containing protein n=1 Tax=Agromyces ramosus TaxID=33879 RepID=A0ABU0RA50_9MICO|nr:hypothetical protein [Agromyces ramosus]MDQ0893919.1 hypothetical protein [Agromyces ramosus]